MHVLIFRIDIIHFVHYEQETVAYLLAALPYLLCHIIQQVGVIIGLELCTVQDVQNQTIGTAIQSTVGRIFVFLITGIVGTRGIDQFQCSFRRVQERNISFHFNFSHIFLIIQTVHDIVGQILNRFQNLIVCIVYHSMKAVIVIIQNFRNFIGTCLVLGRHQAFFQQCIDERGLARTHRANDIDWEHGAVNALERLLKLWIPEVLHRAFLQMGKDIHDFSIDVIIRPTFCKP